jgi:hypothetical protein
MIDLLDLGRLTSNFGPRKSPTAGASSNHKGIDIVLKNSKVPAVVSGKVQTVSYNSARGYYVTIQDSNGYTHTYQHLKSKPNLKQGQTVKEGQTIGIMGSTGYSTGAHLHYEVKNDNGAYLNPVDFLKGADGKPSYGSPSGGGSGSTSGSTSDSGLFGWKSAAKGIASGALTGVFLIAIVVVGVLFLLKAFDLKI